MCAVSSGWTPPPRPPAPLTLMPSNSAHPGQAAWEQLVSSPVCGCGHAMLFQNNRAWKLGTWDNTTPGRGHFTRKGRNREIRPQVPQPESDRPAFGDRLDILASGRALVHAHCPPIPTALLLPFVPVTGRGSQTTRVTVVPERCFPSLLLRILQNPTRRCLFQIPLMPQVTPPAVTTRVPACFCA